MPCPEVMLLVLVCAAVCGAVRLGWGMAWRAAGRTRESTVGKSASWKDSVDTAVMEVVSHAVVCVSLPVCSLCWSSSFLYFCVGVVGPLIGFNSGSMFAFDPLPMPDISMRIA